MPKKTALISIVAVTFVAVFMLLKPAAEINAPADDVSRNSHTTLAATPYGGESPAPPAEPAEGRRHRGRNRDTRDNPAATLEKDALMKLIPDWLREGGDIRRERIQVNGDWVERARGRYTGTNDSMVEIEVTDVGESATTNHFKSLGFDYALATGEEDGGFRITEDRADYLMNLAYSDEGGEGNLQVIVADRFLMEVQLEGLSLEAFQQLEDRDGLIARLLKRATKR